ncbi:MAG: LysR family transcriptional regulator [Alphaproteobacteria bacterium]|nr:LysR family transcriptional regulator [Alphaproteobacteria bacterium]
MNMTFLRYFMAVADSSSFTVAAEHCHVTQPTLSAGIARLEEELGARLFDRGRRTGLTAAGQRLLPHARAMIEEWHAARAEQRVDHRPRLVRIAIASTVPIMRTLAWLSAAGRHEGLEFEISEGTAVAVAERWRRARCDVALFPSRDTLAATNAIALWREPYLLAAATNHRIATRARWSIGELSDTPFILRAACEAHSDAEHLFARHGVRPRAVLRSADEERCAGAVLAGLGVCLMPQSLLRDGMVSAEIRELGLERRVMLAWRKSADEAIVTALREAATAGPLVAR